MAPPSAGCGCKVGRTIDEFGLTDLDDDLAARRAGASTGPESLRDLADHFNRAVLERAMERAGASPLEGEVENVYRILTGDDAGTGARVRTRNRLEREGVDLDAVEDAFVSHPTMGAHLRDCLEVTPSRDSTDPVEAARERLFKLQTRTERVVETTVDGLASAGHLAAGTLAVTVDVQVTCEDCGAHGDLSTFVDRGGCDCDRDGDG